jgi:IS30 family transposase
LHKSDKYTPEQWKEAQRIYEHSGASVRKIAEQTKIPQSTIESEIRRKGWRRPQTVAEAALAKTAKNKLEAKLETVTQLKAEKLVDKAAEFREQAIKQSFETLKVVNELTERLKNSKLDTETLAECVQKLTSSHKQLTDAGWKQFGLDEQKTTVKVGLFLPVTIIKPAGAEPTDQRAIGNTIDVETSSLTDQLSSSEANNVDNQ